MRAGPGKAMSLELRHLHHRIRVLGITVNGKPVTLAHELAHVIQQRGIELSLDLEFPTTLSSPAAQVSAWFTSGAHGIHLADTSDGSRRYELSGFAAAVGPTPSASRPGRTKWPPITLKRGH